MKPWYNVERVKQPGSVVLREWMAKRLQASKPVQKRFFEGAEFSRLTANWQATNTSGDSEILTSLRTLRARSRQLVRDNEYAKNAMRIVQNNVIGSGIGMQALVASSAGKLQSRFNDQIEQAWQDWAEAKTCHVAGKLAFADIERLALGQLFEAGEVLIRKIRQPFGGGQIPFAIEVIEADRLVDQIQTAKAPNGNMIRMGVEVDEWGRAVAYWLHPKHPGDYQFMSFDVQRFIRIPADEIIHLYMIERWPQTRGVPWMHACLRRLNDMHGYSEAEIIAARASANIVGFFTTPDGLPGDDVQNNQRIYDAEPGTFQQLNPGENFVGFNPSRPNAALEPFMRFMLRSMAAAVGVSYESLSRDYSQSNYSSSRLALLDDRALWRILQGWFIRSLRQEIHREWLDAAVLSGAVTIPDYFSNTKKYQRVRFKPRGWSWIDPTKEVTAYKLAVRSGFTTVSDVIADTAGGLDAEDVFKARRDELDMMADLDLIFDTDPAQVNDKGQAQAATPANESDTSPNAADGDVAGNTDDASDSSNDSTDDTSSGLDSSET
ncbi:phage portal protein [Parvibium lacunae]|uniref:Phage portal protein n=1 Tax=Parvibium lacunae TaxID=1888893 RepID=A0A368L7Y6_9BURK|nr:phage portal protein [Parvibium lacunae]RCS59724.1 phage portal protein [Parvibium lacunae]